MKLTTKDIIKILPFDKDFKESLMADYGNLDPDQRFEIEQTIWLTFDAIRQMKLQENVRVALEQLGSREEKISPEFFQKIKQQTDDELKTSGFEDVKEADLEAARKALEDILKQKNGNSESN